MSDAYLRTGRGGAGNFYSQKDVEDAAKGDRKDDIEAQIPVVPLRIDDNSTAPSGSRTGTSLPPDASSSSASGVYARSGRGGAGNFVPTSSSTSTTLPSSTLPTSQNHAHAHSDTPDSSAQATAAPPKPQPKHSGRGGAGNWGVPTEEAKSAIAEQEAKRREALDAGIAREIRDTLPQPPRTYHLHAPGRGRKPEV